MSASASPIQTIEAKELETVIKKEVVNNNNTTVKEEKNIQVASSSEAAIGHPPLAYNNYARNLLLVQK